VVYEGEALLTVEGRSAEVRVRLAGRLDPIDGKYHWQGLILEGKPLEGMASGRDVAVTIGSRSAVGRIAERTPWGTHSLVGTGEPPFDYYLADTD
jgi:Domain of unknown function (DUF4873)